MNLGLLEGLHGLNWGRGRFQGLIPVHEHTDDGESNADPLKGHDFFSGVMILVSSSGIFNFYFLLGGGTDCLD